MFKSASPIGLDITPTSLTAVALKKRGKVYAVEQVVVGALEHGIVADGEVLDVERLGAAIADLWKREGLSSKTVNLGVANQRCILRVVDEPRIKNKKDLKAALGFVVEESLPIPFEDAIWDFHTLGEFEDPTSGVVRQRHAIVMAYRESLERFRDAAELAGLKVSRIDLAAFAVMRSGLAGISNFAALEQSSDSSGSSDSVVALCDIGPTSTNVVVSRNGVCELNRIVSFGTHIFSQTLVDQFGWSFADADRVKLEAGVLPLGGIESPGDPYADSRRIMQYVADQFAQEIRTSFDYYHHSSGGTRIARVILSGEGALLRGLEERFATELSIPVSILDASARIDPSSHETLGVNHAHLGTALGLGMEGAA